MYIHKQTTTLSFYCSKCKITLQIVRTDLLLARFPSFAVKCLSITNEPRHDKSNKISVRPAKTQISLGIRPV